MKIEIFLFGFLLLITSPAFSQITPRYGQLLYDSLPDYTGKRKSLPQFQLDLENGGMILPNKKAAEDFGDVYYVGLNLRVGWQTHPEKDTYHRIYRYPIYGIGLYSSTFSKPEIGTPFAVYGFVAIPILSGVAKRWDFNYRISLGLASNFKAYDEFANPNNLMIGSHRTVYIDLGAMANYRLGDRYQIGFGLAYHHFSNGALKLPNAGINLIPLTVSLTYNPKRAFPLYGRPNVHTDAVIQYHLQYAGGLKQFSLTNTNRYFKSTLSFFKSYPLGYKWRIGGGFDAFYSDAGRHVEIAGENAGKWTSVLSGGPAFYIDHVLTQKLYINGNVGLYVNRNEFNDEKKPFYLRIGARYKVYQNTYTGVSIKAHMGNADFIEWTVGHSWSRKGR
ncbi:acyloxyacyl hydrolase [Dyadobacter crusticola]|uniref:acyloxyacyl hydrolase n=1 Tax=Dyadobacter crusticola TaxID=292407 RepID=UPI000689D473|nr:acyloxyacyl hydrolase [Dyadobacter crusticola]